MSASEPHAIIVTGAARGIGAAIARLAGTRGYDVVVNYLLNQASANEVVTDIQRAGRHALAIAADVAEESQIVRMFESAERQLGPIVAVVNNAGITGGLARVENLDAPILNRLFAVNVTGAMICAREAVRRMSTKRGGRGGCIVNVSSMAAQLGGAHEWVHYAASKGAIDTMTIGLAREVAGEGIRVNAVAPGLIETDLHASAGAPDRVDRMAPTIPMARSGTVDEVAEAVMWLISPAASYITGAILPVSGGR